MTRDQFDTVDNPLTEGATSLGDSDGDVLVVDDDVDDHAVVDITGSSTHQPDDAHLSTAEVARLRTVLNDGSLEDETSRIKWFMLGFLAALLSLVIAAIAFLAISDDDNDGDVDIEVPTLDVDIDG